MYLSPSLSFRVLALSELTEKKKNQYPFSRKEHGVSSRESRICLSLGHELVGLMKHHVFDAEESRDAIDQALRSRRRKRGREKVAISPMIPVKDKPESSKDHWLDSTTTNMQTMERKISGNLVDRVPKGDCSDLHAGMQSLHETGPSLLGRQGY